MRFPEPAHAPTAASGTQTKAFIDPKADCSDYKPTAGIDGDTITIGTVRPASGPYSIYDTVTKGIEKYFAAANAKGGIKAGDGKTYKVNLLKEDDGYDPGRTPALVKKLVEQDGVFGLVGDIGTETNLAVRQYLDDSQAHTIDCDRITVAGVAGDRRAPNDQSRGVGQGVPTGHLSEFLDNSGEHRASSRMSIQRVACASTKRARMRRSSPRRSMR